jgi:acetyl esterase/lipase
MERADPTPEKPRPRWLRAIVGWTALALGAVAFATHFLTPWPSVLVIRAIFDRGAASASAKLERHVPQGIVTRHAVRYAPSDPDALLDIHRPSRLDPTAPTIVWVHGGGFVSGQREDLTHYLRVLAGRGFAVVNVDYTIAPGATYPTPVRQVAAALGFIDREGARLGLNRDAIVLAGDSAGAQIAAQTTNVVTSPAYAQAVGIASPLRPAQLKGALLYCGVFDLEAMGTAKGGVMGWFMRTVTWSYSGDRDWRRVSGFDRFSVARHLTPRFPPTFISAGNADPLEPQSHVMAAALRRAGVPVQSLFYPADHPVPLGHEYQFDLDTADGKRSLDQSVQWLNGLAPIR